MDGAQNFNKTINNNWYVLTVGLPKIEQPINLALGITLNPLLNSLSVFDLAAAGASGFRGWAVLEPIAQACTCEIESLSDASLIPGYDTLNRAWLTSALLVLRGFTRHLCVAVSSYSWNKVAGIIDLSGVLNDRTEKKNVRQTVHKPKKNLPKFVGNLLDYHLKILVDEHARSNELTDDDVSWIRSHFDAFNQLASESESFNFALEAAIDWRYAKDARSAVARLWSGIEAIFGISSELVYRISILSACLHAPRGKARRRKFEQVKKLYIYRSKIVHGDNVHQKKINFALNGSYRLLADLLLLAVEHGRSLSQEDFNSALFD